MTVDSLERAIVIGFAAACAVVFVAAASMVLGAIVRARRLAARAKGLVPPRMIAHMEVARVDARRAGAALQALGPLARRASLAAASIALSLETYRAQIARMRGSAP